MRLNDRLATSLQNYTRGFDAGLAQARRDLSGKSVHDLRVAIRRVRSVLWILRRTAEDARVENVDRRLKKIAHALGHARELDVAIKDARVYELQEDRLKQKRKKRRKSVAEKIGTPAKQAEIQRDLSHAAEVLRRSPGIPLAAAIGRLSRRLQKRRAENWKKNAQIHRLRLETKRVRYVLEALGVSCRPLKDLQDTLGKIHDLEVLTALTGESRRRMQTDEIDLKAKLNKLSKYAIPFALHELDQWAESDDRAAVSSRYRNRAP